MDIFNKSGSKERLFEMFEKVNKTKVVENKEEKKTLREGYTELGHKVKNSRVLQEDIGESFDSPKPKDEKYLDKDYDNVQDNKYDDGVRYPVEEPLKVDDPSLEGLKGDDAPLYEEGDTIEGLPPLTQKRVMRDDEILGLARHVDSLAGEGENEFVSKFIEDSGLTPNSLKSMVMKSAQRYGGGQDDDYFKIENLISVLNDIMDQKIDPKIEKEREDTMRQYYRTPKGKEELQSMGEAEEDVDSENIETDMVDDIPLPGSGEDEAIEGGLADGKEPIDYDADQIAKGIKVEMEHTDDPKTALEIAMDHLEEIPDYYDHLEQMEDEATAGDPADGEEVVDAMGDGQEGEASEEIPDPEKEEEKEVLWGKMDTIGEPEEDLFENYSPRKLGEGKKKDPRLEKAGVEGYNKPKRTPNHPTKSHIVVAKEGDKVKTIRFGQQGVSGAGDDPKTKKEKKRQKSFKARHKKNIDKGKMSAAYWADREKW